MRQRRARRALAAGMEGRLTQGRKAYLQAWNWSHLDQATGRMREESRRGCDERVRLEALANLAEKWGVGPPCERR